MNRHLGNTYITINQHLGNTTINRHLGNQNNNKSTFPSAIYLPFTNESTFRQYIYNNKSTFMQHLTINRHLGDQNNNKSTFTSVI